MAFKKKFRRHGHAKPSPHFKRHVSRVSRFYTIPRGGIRM